MNELLNQYLLDGQSLGVTTILINNVVAFVGALFIMFTYKTSYSGSAYSQKFNVSLGMITLIITMIMSLIGSNIALSLGLVGALSIIRFRTAVKDVRDATFIFWSIAVGIGCGVSEYLLVSLGSVFIFVFLLVFRQLGSTNRHLLVIRCNNEVQNRVEAIVEDYFKKNVRLSMKNATQTSCEFVYLVSENTLKTIKSKAKLGIVESLVRIEGVLNVNLVEQTDDIGR